jgi:hypothetical protein
MEQQRLEVSAVDVNCPETNGLPARDAKVCLARTSRAHNVCSTQRRLTSSNQSSRLSWALR